MSVFGLGIDAVERGLVPDVITRRAIRRLCIDRLRQVREAQAAKDNASSRFFESMRSGSIAPVPEKANEQHYELPPDFFGQVLGAGRKYSSCHWPEGVTTLDEAEISALKVTCERAELADRQKILELGCGWGSLSLWMAENYPNAQITAVSNSALQRKYIEATAIAKGFINLRVITADMNEFDPDNSGIAHGSYDRVVSVEMFEHMRNYELLFNRISKWMKPDGKLFIHIFSHRELAYPFESEGDANWMGRYFFTGGIMPSADLFRTFDRDLRVTRQWKWNGQHYQKTADSWLANLDQRRSQILPVLELAYGRRDASRWLNRWRMFFLACSELFGYADGNEWFVSHYLMERNHSTSAKGPYGS